MKKGPSDNNGVGQESRILLESGRASPVQNALPPSLPPPRNTLTASLNVLTENPAKSQETILRNAANLRAPWEWVLHHRQDLVARLQELSQDRASFQSAMAKILGFLSALTDTTSKNIAELDPNIAALKALLIELDEPVDIIKRDQQLEIINTHDLVRHHPLLLSYVGLINRVDSLAIALQQRFTVLSNALKEIGSIYQDFLNRLVASDLDERPALFIPKACVVGDCIDFGLLENYLGLFLLSRDRFGQSVKKNIFGVHPVAEFNGVFYKPNVDVDHSGLSNDSFIKPGMEYSIYSLLQIFAGEHCVAAPTGWIKIKHVQQFTAAGEPAGYREHIVQTGLGVSGMSFHTLHDLVLSMQEMVNSVTQKNAIAFLNILLKRENTLQLFIDANPDLNRWFAKPIKSFSSEEQSQLISYSIDLVKRYLNSLPLEMQQLIKDKQGKGLGKFLDNSDNMTLEELLKAWTIGFSLRTFITALLILPESIVIFDTVLFESFLSFIEQAKHFNTLIPNADANKLYTSIPNFLSRLDLEHFSATCIGHLLARPEDAKRDNFQAVLIRDPQSQEVVKFQLVGIDNDLALVNAVYVAKNKHYINLKCILFFLEDAMRTPVNETTRQFILSRPAILWLLNWAKLLFDQHERCFELKRQSVLVPEDFERETGERKEDGSTQKIPVIDIPNTVTPTTFSEFYQDVISMLTYFEGSQNPTHDGLFRLLQPVVAEYYDTLRKQSRNIKEAYEIVHEKSSPAVETVLAEQLQAEQASPSVESRRITSALKKVTKNSYAHLTERTVLIPNALKAFFMGLNWEEMPVSHHVQVLDFCGRHFAKLSLLNGYDFCLISPQEDTLAQPSALDSRMAQFGKIYFMADTYQYLVRDISGTVHVGSVKDFLDVSKDTVFSKIQDKEFRVKFLKMTAALGQTIAYTDRSQNWLNERLQEAVSQGLAGAVRILIQAGADVNYCDDAGRSLLHIVFSRQHHLAKEDFLNTLGELVKESTLNYHSYDQRGFSPLLTLINYADRKKFSVTLAAFKVLASKGGNLEQTDAHSGESALDRAVSRDNPTMFIALLQCGAGFRLNVEKAEPFIEKYIANRDYRKVMSEARHRLEQKNSEYAFRLALSAVCVAEYVPGALAMEGTEHGKLYLRPECVGQLFTPSGEFQKKQDSQFGRRTVVPLHFADKDQIFRLHAKENPELPGEEYKVRRLRLQLIGHGAPPSELFKCYNIHNQAYPLLLSKTIVGRNLFDVLNDPTACSELQSKLDPESLSEMLVTALLINPEDDKPDNYIVEPINTPAGLRYRLVCVDNDHAFVDPIGKDSQKRTQLQVKCILFCLDAMKKAIHPKVVAKFLALNPEQVLREWLTDLANQQDRYQNLFSKAEHKQLFSRGNVSSVIKDVSPRGIKDLKQMGSAVRQHLANPQTPTVTSLLIKPELVSRLYDTLLKIQKLFKKNPCPTGMQLLNYVTPELGVRYEEAFDAYDTVLERFDSLAKHLYSKAIAGRYGTMMNSHQVLDSLNYPKEITVDPKLQADFGPKKALIQLNLVHLQQMELSKITAALQNGDLRGFEELVSTYQKEQVVNSIDWSSIKDPKIQTAILQSMCTHAVSLRRLRFAHCTQLTVTQLTTLLKNSPNLERLDVSYCPIVDDNIVRICERYAEQLEVLNLRGNLISKFETRGLMKLRRVICSDCVNLENMLITGPKDTPHTALTDIRIDRSMKLTAIDINSTSAKKISHDGFTAAKVKKLITAPKKAPALVEFLDIMDPNAHLERAYRLFEMEEYSDAIKECDAAIRLDPKPSAALACRGSCKFKLELNTQALEDLDQAIAIDVTNFYAFRDRALCLAALGQHEKAISNFTTVLMRQALGIAPTTILDNVAISEPVKTTHQRTRFFPIGPLSLSKIGYDHFKAMTVDSTSPGNPYFQPNSDQAVDGGSVDGNTVSDNSYFSMDPSLWHTCRGCSHMELMQYSTALYDFNSAITMNPKNASAHLNRGKYHASQKKYKEALIDFNEAISLNPDDPEGYICRGEVKDQYYELDSEEDFLKAIALCHQVLSRNKNFIRNRPNRVRPRMLCYLAQCSLYRNEIELALSCIDEAITFEPNNVAYLSLREKCRSRLNPVFVSSKDEVAAQASIEAPARQVEGRQHDNASDIGTLSKKVDAGFESNRESVASETKSGASKKTDQTAVTVLVKKDITISAKVDDPEIPSNMICPLTGNIIEEPVELIINEIFKYTYERSALEEWFLTHSTDPFYKVELKTATFREQYNTALRKAIDDFARAWMVANRDGLNCPLNKLLMVDPVELKISGVLFDRAAIVQWLTTHSTCPVTGLKIYTADDRTLISHEKKKRVILIFRTMFARAYTTPPLASLAKFRIGAPQSPAVDNEPSDTQKMASSSGQAFSPESKLKTLAAPSEEKPSQCTSALEKDLVSPEPIKRSRTIIVKKDGSPSVLMASRDEKSTLSTNPADHTITIGIYGTVKLPANFLGEHFGANYQATTGRWTKRITVDGKTSDLVIYIDTQSDAKFAATFSIYPSNCDCIIVLADASTSINRGTWHIYDAMHREDILSSRPLIFSGVECDPNKSALWTVEDFTEMNRPCDFAYMIRPGVAGNISNLFEVAARKTIALRANPRSFESRTAGKVDIIGVEVQPPKKSPKAAGVSRPFFLGSSPEGRTSPFNRSGTKGPQTPSASAVSAPFALTTSSDEGMQSPVLKKGSRFSEKKLESSKESISSSGVASVQSTHSPVASRGSRLGRRATESSTGSVPYTLLSSPRGLYDIPADYTIRIGVQGKKGCGKFRLIQQFCHGEDVNAEAVKNSNYEWKKRIRIDDKVCDLIIQRNVDLETCDCVIILADVKAFLDRETWVYFDSLYQNQAEALNSRPLIFAGTKHENSVGELWSLYDFVRMNKPCDYAVMTSAENNVNVAELFVTAARKTMELKLHPQAFYERHPQMPEYAHPDSAQDTYSPVNWRGH